MIKSTSNRVVLTYVLAVGLAGALQAASLGTSYNYQGYLSGAGGAAAQGVYDFRFTIYDDATAGSALGTVTQEDVLVKHGLFTTELDFGLNVFTGDARWLEVGVRHGADTGDFTRLAPRQSLKAVPNALFARSVPADGVIGPLASGQLPANPTFAGTVVAGGFQGDGSGVTNVPGTIRWQEVTGSAQQAMPNSSYTVCGEGEVTITLPTTCALGDVVRVSGTGPGGWRLAQNPGQLILTENIGAGVPGVVWVPRESNREWVSIASSSDGRKLVAVARGAQMYTSSDYGARWTARESVRDWYCVASSADGNKLVAVVREGQIYTSTDSGVTWTPRESDRPWEYVASSADGTKVVAADGQGSGNGGRLYTSVDSGVSWTPRDSERHWSCVASSADGFKLVALEWGSYVYTSTDAGETWEPRSLGGYWPRVISSPDGNRLIATDIGWSAGYIHISTDGGASWTDRGHSTRWQYVASSADGTKLVAVAWESGPYNQIYTSHDAGVTWTERPMTNQSWSCVASSADGTRFFAGTLGGQIYTSARTTAPGTAGSFSGAQGSEVELVYVGDNQYRVLHASGALNVEGTPVQAGPEGAWKLGGNTGTTSGTHFLGTTDNEALELKVNGTRALRLEPNAYGANVIAGSGNSVGSGAAAATISGGVGGSIGGGANASTIGGGSLNAVSQNSSYGTIGGGFLNTIWNDVDYGTIAGGFRNVIFSNAYYGFVGGGFGNILASGYSTIGGGTDNRISTNAHFSTIGGGEWNGIRENAGHVFIGGGHDNTVHPGAAGATICGGQENTIQTNAAFGVIPGGLANSVGGAFGFAAGFRAKADHSGAFVWADSTDANFASTGANQFLVRAGGGVGINVNEPAAALDVGGTARVRSTLRLGSETGTSEPPSPAGLVVRRINSRDLSPGQIVARTDNLTLERNGTSGGWVIRYPAVPGNAVIACMGMDSTGAPRNFYTTLDNPGTEGTVEICSDSQGVVHLQCSFGITSVEGGHLTQVTLTRHGTHSFWSGTVSSTFNQ